MSQDKRAMYIPDQRRVYQKRFRGVYPLDSEQKGSVGGGGCHSTAPVQRAFRCFFFLPLNGVGACQLSPCARRSRPFLGRAIREHRERTVSSHHRRTMMMYQQPLIPDPLEQIRG